MAAFERYEEEEEARSEGRVFKTSFPEDYEPQSGDIMIAATTSSVCLHYRLDAGSPHGSYWVSHVKDKRLFRIAGETETFASMYSYLSSNHVGFQDQEPSSEDFIDRIKDTIRSTL